MRGADKFKLASGLRSLEGTKVSEELTGSTPNRPDTNAEVSVLPMCPPSAPRGTPRPRGEGFAAPDRTWATWRSPL